MEAANRASCRAQLSKVCNSVENYMDNEMKNETDAMVKEGNINVQLCRVKNAHQKLLQADEKMQAKITEDNWEQEFNKALEYDDRAVRTIAKLEFELRKLQVSNNSENLRNEMAPPRISNETSIKLKSLELKQFDGNFENWIPFWEQYKQVIHSNPNLDVASKFTYLSNALVGKAAAVITGFLPTERCYNDAIELLNEEYGNTEQIIDKYIQKLLNIRVVNSSSDVRSLRNLYNETRATMRTLSSLCVSPTQYDIMVYSIVLKALPVNMKINFHKRQQQEKNATGNKRAEEQTNSNLEDLLEYIKIDIEALEKAQVGEKENKRGEERKSANFAKGTAVGLHTSFEKTQIKCVFCKLSNHDTKNCRKNMTVEQRKKVLKEEGRCFKCSKKNHSAKYCKNNWIKCAVCKGNHLTLLCERKNKETNVRNNENNNNNEEASAADSVHLTSSLNIVKKKEENIFLQTAKAIILNKNNDKDVLTRCIMDNGSQRTYITEELANALELPTICYEEFKILAFGEINERKKANRFKQVKFYIKSQYRSNIMELSAIVVPNICSNVLPVPMLQDKKYNFIQNRLAENIVVSNDILPGINLLIGQDNYWLFNTNKIERLSESRTAVFTHFGWTIQGGRGKNNNNNYIFHISQPEDDFNVSKFWELESIGILNNDDAAISNTMTSIRMIRNRYSVSLPWKLDKSKLDSNRNNAENRLKTLTSRLICNKEKLIEYHNGILELLTSDIAEKVDETLTNTVSYYMPHRPVYRADKKTTKMRIVFDASSCAAEFGSLNEFLSPGENLIADLLSVLLRFRSKPVALTADIEKAFLQISIDEDDRDTHRFLWYEAIPKMNEKLPNIVEMRMKRVTFGVTSSPFLLSAVIRKHVLNLKDKYPSTSAALLNAFYVDDLLVSCYTVEEAKNLFYEGRDIMSRAQFNLRKWNSNNLEVRKYFGIENQYDQDAIQKILGVNWFIMQDDIGVDLERIIETITKLKPTKRSVMSAMARIYDPLGILSPFTMRLKVLLQKIWKAKNDWDSILNDDLKNEFETWQTEFELLKDFKIPRSLCETDNCWKEIHIFADASPKAYGVVAYLRTTNDELITNKFICSKNKISPITKTGNEELSLPKLELTAALVAARLKDFLLRNIDIKIDKVYLWSDSMITLNWISGCGNRIKPYVTARVKEILKLTNIYDWFHCDGKHNPADLITRGVTAKSFIKNELWLNGPTWLLDRHFKPLSNENMSNILTTFSISEGTANNNSQQFEMLTKYSSVKKLLRVTAYVMRFYKNLKAKNSNRCLIQKTDVIKSPTAEEIDEAQQIWLKQEQKRFYEEEVKYLRNQKSIPATSKLLCLNPFMDGKGVMRIRCRISEEDYEEGLTKPAILPKHSHLSKLLIMEAHNLTMHGGVNTVLAYIRKKFWIIQGRQLIKSILNQCVVCKKLKGKNACEQWSLLPAERIITTRPFKTTGIDFAGPLYVKSEAENTQIKVYVMLCTCAAIRAVHLELVKDLTVKSCIDALRRFIARRGCPETIMSDNAQTFKRANKELEKLERLIKTNEFQSMSANKGINWKFIPERAAWWGGFWERLVKSVKICLKSAIGKNVLTYDELNTLLTEVEYVVNIRPLTYISNDARDLEPLSPAHFLNTSQQSIIMDEINYDGSEIADLWKKRQSKILKFIKRWKQEYLNQLRGIYFNKPQTSRSVKEGDVVLVGDNLKNRLLWKMGVIQTTYYGRDNRVRACDVYMGNKQLLKRPIQLLYPLEVSRGPGCEK